MSGRAFLSVTNNMEIVSKFSVSHIRELIYSLLPSKALIFVMSYDLFNLGSEDSLAIDS